VSCWKSSIVSAAATCNVPPPRSLARFEPDSTSNVGHFHHHGSAGRDSNSLYTCRERFVCLTFLDLICCIRPNLLMQLFSYYGRYRSSSLGFLTTASLRELYARRQLMQRSILEMVMKTEMEQLKPETVLSQVKLRQSGLTTDSKFGVFIDGELDVSTVLTTI